MITPIIKHQWYLHRRLLTSSTVVFSRDTYDDWHVLLGIFSIQHKHRLLCLLY